MAAYYALAWGTLAAVAWAARPWAAVVVLAVAAYTTAPVLAFVRAGGAWRRYPSAAFRLAVVRPALYAQLLLPLAAAAGVVGVLAGAGFGRAGLAGGFAALGVALLGGLVLVAGWAGSRRLRVREVDAHLPGLPAAFDGLRVVQLSDLHLGPQTSRRFLARAVRAAAALRPDLVVLTGDLVDDRAEDAPGFARWVEALRNATQPEFGLVAVPGNHDVYAGWPAVADALRRLAPMRVLVNDAHRLHRGGHTLAVVGTGDPAGGRGGPDSAGPDIARAFAGVRPGETTLVLAHNPALFAAIQPLGPGLTLSGHTHWGQFALPRRGWSLASPFQEFAMGGYQRGDALLYVHPGTGFWGIPFRLGAFPEVTAVTLRTAAGGGALSVGEARRAP
jgi:predicted MPP superfamily phosphohydrolase